MDQPPTTRAEALDDWDHARAHYGPDAPETIQAAQNLEALLTTPEGNP